MQNAINASNSPSFLSVPKGARWSVLLPVCVLLLSGCRYGDSTLWSNKADNTSNTKQSPALSLQLVQNGAVHNRASQIEVLATRVVDVPYVSKSNKAVRTMLRRVIVKWRNKGPRPVGMVRARIQLWDNKGKELSHSPTTVTIFFARGATRRIKAGQVYDEPAGSGMAVFGGPPKAARAKAVIVYADSAAHAYDDIHVGRGLL